MAYDILKRTQELRDQQNSKPPPLLPTTTDLKKLRIGTLVKSRARGQ